MCKDLYVYRCSVCKQVVISPVELKNTIRCCERDMELLAPGTVDASEEAHVPVFEQCGCYLKVKIGQTPHPMTNEHHIEWIALVTDKSIYIKYLEKTEHPCATFHIDPDEKVCAVYAYCNLHQLWMAKDSIENSFCFSSSCKTKDETRDGCKTKSKMGENYIDDEKMTNSCKSKM